MRSVPLLVVAALLAPLARAQVVFSEVEPNSERFEATAAVCVGAGDVLTGTTTGGSVLAGDATSASADTFRVRTCPLAAGIWRHELALTSATPGQTSTLRGLVQSGVPGAPGVRTTIDATVSTAVGSGSAPRVLAWYGRGSSEEVYWRVAGTPGTTQPYIATLSSSLVDAVPIGSFVAGSITITSVGQGHGTDTDLWLYDAALAPIPLAGNDDLYQSSSVQSQLVRTLAPGTYHVAIAPFNLANDQVSPADDDFVQGNVLDFPGATATSQTLANLDVSFAVSDAGHTVPVAAAVNVGRAHEVAWFRFEVVAPFFESFCPGDGTEAQPCPCANSGAAGHGCANSANAQGALLVASGGTNPDTVVLSASGMPSLAYSLFLKGDAQNAGVVFGDGVRCVDGALIRLRLKLSSNGASSYPEPGDPSLSVRGQTPPGSASLAFYQTYYRNAAATFCPPATFNVTNGWRIVW